MNTEFKTFFRENVSKLGHTNLSSLSHDEKVCLAETLRTFKSEGATKNKLKKNLLRAGELVMGILEEFDANDGVSKTTIESMERKWTKLYNEIESLT